MLDACYVLFASLALLRMLHVLLLSRCALHMCVHTPLLVVHMCVGLRIQTEHFVDYIGNYLDITYLLKDN